MKGMATCKICGRDFALIAENTYIARDNEKKGVFSAIAVSSEEAIYDAIDCPHCGCQNILQERKRTFLCPCEDCESCEEDDKVTLESFLKHLDSGCHGCVDCNYNYNEDTEEPCKSCIHCEDDAKECKYEPKKGVE